MASNDGRFSLWAVITTAALVGSAMASGAWYIARAGIDDELRQYDRSKAWQLPQLLSDLRVVSANLRVQLAEQAELRRLRSRVPALEQEAKELAAQLTSRNAELAELHKQFDPLSENTFVLQRGEAREIVPGDIVLGVKDVSSVTGKVEVQFNGTLEEIVPGATLRAAYGGTEYRITLVRITDGGLGSDKATFSLIRRPIVAVSK